MDIEAQLRAYQASRYLLNATSQGLDQRLHSIGNNLWSTDRDGIVTPIRNQETRRGLLHLYLDTLFEKCIRQPIDLAFDEAKVRAESSRYYTPPKLRGLVDFGPQCFAKFGKRKYMFDALECGSILVRPAASFNDASLNAAQRDEELEHHVRTANERILAKLHGQDSEGKEVEMTPQWGELFRYMEVPNFYVWCFGMSYDARMFTDFEADAALIILDNDAFVARFEHAMMAVLPTGRFEQGPIAYYDPYTAGRDQLRPAFSKNLSYLYQNEYRVVWWMPEGSNLVAVKLDLGPLTDIATVVELAETG